MDECTVPCVREVSEARRPSWKLTAGRLPWAWGRRWEERVRWVSAGSRAPLSAREARSVDIPPIASCKVWAGLDEDFRQPSEEAPSEGQTTMPTETQQAKQLKRWICNSGHQNVLYSEAFQTNGLCITYLHGGLHWWKRADTSASVCLREVVLGGSKGAKVCVASSSSRSLGRTSSLMLVSSRLLGEMERFQSSRFRLASTGNTTR